MAVCPIFSLRRRYVSAKSNGYRIILSKLLSIFCCCVGKLFGTIFLMTHSQPKHHQPTYIDDRFPGPDPYAPLADLPALKVTSETFNDGDRIPEAQLAGSDISPQLSWEPGPAGTKTYAVTCFDPDAPTGSGYWHWAVFNIPADVTHLDLGAGSGDLSSLPDGAEALRGDNRSYAYYGPNPPAGHGPHRYLFAVHAVSEELDIPHYMTTTVLGFNLQFKALARGILWGWAENS